MAYTQLHSGSVTSAVCVVGGKNALFLEDVREYGVCVRAVCLCERDGGRQACLCLCCCPARRGWLLNGGAY